MPNSKYIRTARLGEGVIYVADDDEYHAAIIIRQTSETVVDLFVISPDDGSTSIVRGASLDSAASRPGSWAWRPKT